MGVIQEKSYLPYVEIGKLEIGNLTCVTLRFKVFS